MPFSPLKLHPSLLKGLRVSTMDLPRTAEPRATAVSECLQGSVSPLRPSSILQSHPATTVYLDRDSAALLKRDSTKGTR